MYQLLHARTLASARQLVTLRSALPVASRHPGVRSRRCLSSESNHPQRHRQDIPEELLQRKRQAEAVSGELPSSPVGPSIGWGGYGSGGGSGVKDAVLTTVFGIAVRESSAQLALDRI